MLFFKDLKNLVLDAWNFVVDPEARKASKFTYPSGNPMSVRDARKKGLI